MSDEKPKLHQPSRLRLVDDVHHSLQDAILSGRMRPGERLVEMWISEQLGVSRTTVREALLMLEHDGLVVSKPRQGTFVTRLSREEAADLSLVRALLEGFAVSAGSPRFKEDALAQLEGYLDEMRLCRLPDDYPRLIGLDLAFHRLLVEGAQSPRLLELWASLNGEIGALFIRGMEYQHGDIDDVVALHRRLLDAVRSGDPHVAQQATIEHYIGAEESGLGYDVPLMRLIDMLTPRSQGRTNVPPLASISTRLRPEQATEPSICVTPLIEKCEG